MQKHSEVEFLLPGFKAVAEESLEEDYQPKRVSRHNPVYQPDCVLKALSPFIDSARAKLIESKGIPWTTVAEKVKTKSKDDCRNRWYNQVYNTINDTAIFTQKQESDLINYIAAQDAETEGELNFTVANGKSASENKYHWEKLKKIVGARYNQKVSEMANELVEYFRKAPTQKKYEIVADDNNETQLLENKVNRDSLKLLFRRKCS